MPVKDFHVRRDDASDIRILQAPLRAPAMGEFADDLEKSDGGIATREAAARRALAQGIPGVRGQAAAPLA